jgi:predicted TIM-barrel fold metal-dependent hydrolase
MRHGRAPLALLVAGLIGASAFAFQTPVPTPPGPGAPAVGDPQTPPAPGRGGPGGRQGGRGGRGRGVPLGPDGECPAGTTMTRPGNCQAPEFAPPSIVDYRPRTTLVVEQHPVPKAKFPVVDIHGHAPQGTFASAESLANHVKNLDAIGVRVFVAADNVSGANLTRALQVVNASPHKDRFRIFTGVQVNNFGPGSAEKLVAQLEADVKAGAVGIGEIGKGFGLTARKADGTRLAVDEPGLDPVWQAAARLNIPVFIHTAEPQEFFSPLDMKNERWLELSLFADRRNYGPDQVKFEQLMTERDNLFRRHPKTRFIAAHFGWHANDLGRLAKLLDTFPNVTVEAGAILYDLGRQPRAARDFLTKYQDRVLFGKDAFQIDEYPTFWRVFETNDEYFDYYRDYHAFWKMYGLGLSDVVLKKLYYQNALRVTPGLPTAGWPR